MVKGDIRGNPSDALGHPHGSLDIRRALLFRRELQGNSLAREPQGVSQIPSRAGWGGMEVGGSQGCELSQLLTSLAEGLETEAVEVEVVLNLMPKTPGRL